MTSFKGIFPGMNRFPRSTTPRGGGVLVATSRPHTISAEEPVFPGWPTYQGAAHLSRLFNQIALYLTLGRGPLSVEPWGDEPSAIRSTRPFPGGRSRRVLGGLEHPRRRPTGRQCTRGTPMTPPSLKPARSRLIGSGVAISESAPEAWLR